MNLEDILLQLESSTDYYETMEKLLPPKKFYFTKILIDEIKLALEKRKDEILEYLLFIAYWDGLDNGYTQLLCTLLLEKWHHDQETIAKMLEDIKDNSSVDCLYTAAIDIPDFDDGRALAKKCMWALAAINTDDAKHKLLLLAKHEDTIVREFALERL
jgi:hypothetical protein